MNGQPKGVTNKPQPLDALKHRGDFLRGPYAEMPPEAVLAHFQNRRSVALFPASKGKPVHVQRADQILKNRFTFNNKSYALGEHFDWKTNPSPDIEWLILLHKFYYAKDLGAAYACTGDENYAEKWVDLILSWIAVVPEGFINSQVTGRRLQQWLLSYRYFVPGAASSSITPDFLLRFLQSVHSQARYLAGHLTPEGNHRTIELYALFLVAAFFPELRGMSDLLGFAKLEILKNMQADLLPDGVQRELSPDYHHTVLKNYLKIRELADLNNISLPEQCDRLIQKALEFSIYVHKPDGFLPMISDGDSKSYLALLEKAGRYYPDGRLAFVCSRGEKGAAPPLRSQGFSESGYYVLRSDWEAEPYTEAFYLFFDCGPLGFGSHGHYDLLNFEMAAYGHTLIVDPGRYTYSEHSEDGVNWRRIFKGTAYHNTVLVDGKDQMPYRKGAPLAPGPTPLLKRFTSAKGFDFVCGAAISREYPVVHERAVFFLNAEYYLVLDHLKAKERHRYDLHFHLHPRAREQVKLEEDEGMSRCTSPNLLLLQPQAAGLQARVEEGFVSPEYGKKEAAPVLRFSQSLSGSARYTTLLYPHQGSVPGVRIECVPVSHQAVLCSEDKAVALKIVVQAGEKFYVDEFFLAHAPSKDGFHFGDIEFRGRLLMLRRDASGQLLRLEADQLEALHVDGQCLLDFGGQTTAVSYENGALSLNSNAGDFQGSLNRAREVRHLRQSRRLETM